MHYDKYETTDTDRFVTDVGHELEHASSMCGADVPGCAGLNDQSPKGDQYNCWAAQVWEEMKAYKCSGAVTVCSGANATFAACYNAMMDGAVHRFHACNKDPIAPTQIKLKVYALGTPSGTPSGAQQPSLTTGFCCAEIVRTVAPGVNIPQGFAIPVEIVPE